MREHIFLTRDDSATALRVQAFRRYSLVALGWTLLVIVWGAYVRASGSGAGCGAHWPICNGELIPRSPTMQTIVEYTHRATSGLALLSVIALVIFAFVATPEKHPSRKWAAWSLFFMLTEAAVGALLVKAELVANNATASRALAMGIHLVNTFLLVAVMTSTCFHAWREGEAPSWKERGLKLQLVLLALVLVTVVGISGATAALGDTLVQQSVQNAFVDFLIQLRILHPLLAIGGVIAAITAGWASWSVEAARRWIVALWTLVVLQVIAGLTNVVLQAPVFMQLIHLLLADLVWIALIVVLRFVVTGDQRLSLMSSVTGRSPSNSPSHGL
ncbi:MAG: COX15/CtaA family protein [Archangium sp.]|nr:COX15/CtaA family protein [Archangium sp.]